MGHVSASALTGLTAASCHHNWLLNVAQRVLKRVSSKEYLSSWHRHVSPFHRYPAATKTALQSAPNAVPSSAAPTS